MASDRSLDDPIVLQIHQEVEEFLRDLTLEYPFHEIFETLRRQGYEHRFGKKVFPFPRKKTSEDSLREVDQRLKSFLVDLKSTFGQKYAPEIDEAIRFFTDKTLEDHDPEDG